MAAKKTEKAIAPAIGDVVTIEVVTPHDGLAKGFTREIHYCANVQYMIDKGYWKFVK